MLINGEKDYSWPEPTTRIERDEWNAAQRQIRAERVRKMDEAIIIVGVFSLSLSALFMRLPRNSFRV